MTMHYSPSLRGFFHPSFHAEMPADAIEISDEAHRSLLDQQTKGAVIVPGDDGAPIALFPQAPKVEQLRAWACAAVKAEAYRRITAAYPIWRQINDLSVSGKASDAAAARRASVDALRAASDALEQRLATMSNAEISAFDVGADEHWAA